MLTVGVAGGGTSNEWSIEPVVSNRLVGMKNNGVTLSSKHVNLLDRERLCELAIGLNDGYGNLAQRRLFNEIQ